MSTALVLTPDELAKLEAGQAMLAELERRKRARPLDFVQRVPWQEPLWHLVMLDGQWRSEWGPRPSRPPTTICVVSGNRTGKSTIQAQVIAAHVRGKLPRFPRQGEVWGGMPTLADSTSIMRPHVERWLSHETAHAWTPKEANSPCESLLRTQEGWKLRLRGYEQDREHWQGGKLQAAYLDEQPPDDVLTEVRQRLIDLDGFLLATFTPLAGTQSMLYRQAYEPWCEYQRKHAGAKWGEVSPGVWVFSVGQRDNAQSAGGYLPDERIELEEAALVADGKVLEARVRFHGEWLDISEDALLPYDRIQEWSEPPRGGWRSTVAWIDPAYTAKASSCETGVALASSAWDGTVYLRESFGVRWEPHEKVPKCADLLEAWDCPMTYVQRVGGDMEFAAALNAEMVRRGRRACVSLWPDKGHVPDKVERAQMFAPMLAAGQARVRPEHAQFKEQARRFSVSFMKAGGAVDCLDAAMGALMRCAEPDAAAEWAGYVQQFEAPRRMFGDDEARTPIDDGAIFDMASEVE